jgi:transcriptional regulator with PAS, ATPase and Fis domain
MDAELFGYEKGAFTDAKSKKEGLFKAADKGIIFLDEIGDMHPELQGKLLRVLEKKTIRKIGGTGDDPVDVMVILATNKDLKKLVESGKFRSDLYFRINAFEIGLPPLRNRRDDILPLTYLFVERYNKKFGKRFTEISEEAKEFLLNYSWPGNVRELKNFIEHAVMVGNGNEINLDMLKIKFVGQGGNSDKNINKDMLNGFNDLIELEKLYSLAKRKIIKKALESCNWNITKTAQKLKIDRSTLNYSIKKLGINKNI